MGSAASICNGELIGQCKSGRTYGDGCF
jgi:hypothetical protein